jgi:invasin B
MTTIASTGTTPLAFVPTNKKTAEGAAKSAAGFGAASMQQIRQIELQMQSQLQTLLADATTQAHAGEANTTKGDAGKPELRQADMQRLTRAAQARQSAPGQRPLTADAVLTLLSLELSAMLNEESTRSLASQLEFVKARLAARAASAAELAAAIELAQKLVESAMGDVGAAEGELAAAMEALRQAQAEVARLEQALADAPEEEKEAIRAQLEAAKAHAGQQQGRVDVAHAKLNEALALLDGALKDLEAFEEAADNLNPNRGTAGGVNQRALTNQAALGELLARLQEIIAKANDEKMAKETEFAKAVLKSREAESQRRAEEYQEQVEKAEQAQKKMGCIGKIVGWVVTTVAVVAAPFTGGASMALAGIGLALAIGEEFGLDIMGKVMEPIMKVVMDLVKAVGSVLGDVLTAIGVPEDVANKIKDVLAVIAVAAMVVAIALLSKKAASNVAVQAVTKAVTKAVTEAVSKALPAIIKSFAHAAKGTLDDIAKAVTNTTAKVISRDADTLAIRAGQATKAMHVLQFANQSAQGIGAGIVAGMEVKAAEIQAKMEESMALSEILRDLIQRILNYFLQSNQQISALFRDLSDILVDQDKTAHHITSHVGRTA